MKLCSSYKAYKSLHNNSRLSLTHLSDMAINWNEDNLQVTPLFIIQKCFFENCMAQNATLLSEIMQSCPECADLKSVQPSCCFDEVLFPSGIHFMTQYKMLQPLLTNSPSILGYLTLLLPPIFVDFS